MTSHCLWTFQHYKGCHFNMTSFDYIYLCVNNYIPSLYFSITRGAISTESRTGWFNSWCKSCTLHRDFSTSHLKCFSSESASVNKIEFRNSNDHWHIVLNCELSPFGLHFMPLNSGSSSICIFCPPLYLCIIMSLREVFFKHILLWECYLNE